MEVHYPLVPATQSLMCSKAAFPAEAAEDNFLAAIIAAPLFPTVGWNSPSTQECSTYFTIEDPLEVAAVSIGTIVGE